MLASEVIESIPLLRDQLNQLIQQLAEGNVVANTTRSLLDEASELLDTSESLLGDSESVIVEARRSLSELGGRVGELESQIERNEVDIQVARNLTSLAAVAADETEMVRGREGGEEGGEGRVKNNYRTTKLCMHMQGVYETDISSGGRRVFELRPIETDVHKKKGIPLHEVFLPRLHLYPPFHHVYALHMRF